VIDSDTVNAFAIPGGYVFVTRGMLALLESESELAGVLGHEISHVVRKHHLRWVYQNKDMQAALRTSREQSRRLDPATAKLLESVGRILQQQQAMMQSGPLRAGIGQSEETEADSDGATLAWRAGYDSYGMVSALQRFEAWQRPRYAALKGELRDHPEPVRRLKMLDVALGSRAEKDTVGEVGGERYAAATRAVRGVTQ
jgi:predicted Zn-dependent protease